MDIQRVVDQIVALDPEFPAYQVSAFALELLEKIKTDGVVSASKHTSFTGYSFLVPNNMTVVQEVWIDGERVPMDMNMGDIEYETEQQQTYMTDEDDSVMTDEDESIMIDEEN